MLYQIRRCKLLCLSLIVISSAFAQEKKQQNLGNLWTQVEKNYSGISAKEASVEAAKLNERSVKSNMLPQLNAQAQNTYSSYDGISGAFFPQSGSFNVSGPGSITGESSSIANSYASATLDLELYSFGKLRKKNAAANALTNRKSSEKEMYILELQKVLSERYIHLLFNTAKLNLAEKNGERLDSIRWITSGLSAAGLRPAADSLLASSSYIQSKAEQDKWNGYKKASYIKLLELYGAEEIDYSQSVQRFVAPTDRNLESNTTINSSHPQLQTLQNQADYFTFSGEAQKRSSLPSLHLIGGYSYRTAGIDSDGGVSGNWQDGFNNSATNYIAGVGITWNLTNLRTNQLKGKELLKESESVKFLQSQYQLAMQSDLDASKAKITQQNQQLIKTRLAVKQSQDAYAMYLARYKSGLITLSELLQLRLLLEHAENSHIEASRDYWIQLANEAELTADFDFLFTNL